MFLIQRKEITQLLLYWKPHCLAHRIRYFWVEFCGQAPLFKGIWICFKIVLMKSQETSIHCWALAS